MIDFVNNKHETKWKREVVVLEQNWSDLKEGDKPDVGSIFVMPAEDYRNVLVRHEASKHTWSVFSKPKGCDIQCLFLAGCKESAEFVANKIAEELSPAEVRPRWEKAFKGEPLQTREDQ